MALPPANCGYASFGATSTQLLQLQLETYDLVFPEMIVFPVFATLFGISLTVSIVCLYYLFKNWRQAFGHYIVTAFSLTITFYNIAAFVLKSMTITRHLYVLVCGTEFLGTFQLGDLFEQSLKLANVFVPTFLWITDGFLLYRTWVIWFQRRTYIFFPALVYIASVVTGVTWLVQATLREFNSSGFNSLDTATIRWIPALGFSCGMDAIATTMIAGRLGYHHLWRRKLVSNHSSPYRSLLIICVESAILSTIAKVLHLTIEDLTLNPVVIPICTLASNLIVLRKALGADVQRTLTNIPLTTLHFDSQEPQSNSSIRVAKEGTSAAPIQSYILDPASIREFGRRSDGFARVPSSKSHTTTTIGFRDAV